MNKKKITKLAVMLLSLVLILGMSVSATIAYLQASAEPVINTFKPVQTAEDALDIDVEGTKKLTGRDWQENDNFTFILEKKVGDKWETVTGGSAYATGNNGSGTTRTFDYSSILESNLAEGTNVFRISELETDMTGVTYDTSKAQFTVEVLKVETTGALKITSVTNVENTTVTKDSVSGKYNVSFGFTNSYTAPADKSIVITVNKTVKNVGDETIGPQGFTFQLKGGDLQNTLQDVSDVDGKAGFALTFDKDDVGKTYDYELSEINDGKQDVKYDDTVHKIQISVNVNKDNELVPVVSINGEKTDEYAVNFINEYDVDTETDPTDKPSDPTKPSDDPTKPSDADKDDGSKTGDDSNMILPIILLIASGLMMVIILLDRRKRRT